MIEQERGRDSNMCNFPACTAFAVCHHREKKNFSRFVCTFGWKPQLTHSSYRRARQHLRALFSSLSALSWCATTPHAVNARELIPFDKYLYHTQHSSITLAHAVGVKKLIFISRINSKRREGNFWSLSLSLTDRATLILWVNAFAALSCDAITRRECVDRLKGQRGPGGEADEARFKCFQHVESYTLDW